MEEPGRFHDATLLRIRQPDRTGAAALPVADEKGRDLLLRREFFRLAFPSRVREQWRECGYVIDFKVGQSFGEPQASIRESKSIVCRGHCQ
jgi:hypothetical protein